VKTNTVPAGNGLTFLYGLSCLLAVLAIVGRQLWIGAL
jgi:hypothetical protein